MSSLHKLFALPDFIGRARIFLILDHNNFLTEPRFTIKKKSTIIALLLLNIGVDND